MVHLVDAMLIVPLICSVVAIVMLCVSFLFTYKERNVIAVILQHVAILVWIFVAILFLGWESGAQQFITLLLVSVFTGSYIERRIKLEYAILLVLIHVGLHLYMSVNVSVYEQTFWEMLYYYYETHELCFWMNLQAVWIRLPLRVYMN